MLSIVCLPLNCIPFGEKEILLTNNHDEIKAVSISGTNKSYYEVQYSYQCASLLNTYAYVVNNQNKR